MTRASLLRLTVGATVALVATVATALFSFALATGPRAPERALTAWRTSVAQSGAASRSMTVPNDRTRLARAERLARAALARSPVNAEAARVLALVAAARGRLGDTRRLIGYSEQVTRRDVPTQLWLIEDRVQAGDVAGALIHYHRAMQTSRASRDLLSPILAQAADDPAITRPLAARLRTRPEWWSNFLGDFVQRTRSPAALGLVTRSLKLDAAIPLERERLSTILERYVALDEVATGRRLFDRLTGNSARAVVQGGFERDDVLLPFGWRLTENAAGAGIREARDGAGGTVALTLDGTEGQEAARQLLALAPGRHVLTVTVGGVRPGFAAPPGIALRCFPADTPIADFDLAVGPGAATVRRTFAVPTGCAAQLLVVRTARAGAYLDEKPWIDDVAIRSVAGAGVGGADVTGADSGD